MRLEMIKQLTAMPKYEAYKESGEAWISEIPEHWEIRKLKQIFYEKKHKKNPDLNCGSISYGKVVIKDDEKIPYSTKQSYQEVLKGEFLINPLNLNYDLISLRISLSSIDVVVSPGYIVLNTHKDINKEYFKYLLHRYDVAYMKLLGSGVRQTINFNHIANSILLFPPLLEQTAIAAFLDRKTAQIDQAVAIKEKQITLLKERKQILIQNAVTRGLHPNAPMRDSGVEWIGEIPAHWVILANRVLFRERIEPGEDGLPLLSVSIHTAVSSEEISEDENIRGRIKIEDKTRYNLVQPGDIVFNMMRAWQGAIGAVKVKGMVSPAYIIATPNKEIMSSYFEYQYRCPEFIQQMDRYSKGITDFRKRLYWSEFKQLATVAPPIEEQTAIVSHIETESAKIEKAIAIQQQQIDKLKEYKTTLINSAVTGKIKVPELIEGRVTELAEVPTPESVKGELVEDIVA
jgi:type I restriction enzyme S subunit